jgi:hypothetical protein
MEQAVMTDKKEVPPAVAQFMAGERQQLSARIARFQEALTDIAGQIIRDDGAEYAAQIAKEALADQGVPSEPFTDAVRTQLAADNCEVLRARLAQYEDADGNPIAALKQPKVTNMGGYDFVDASRNQPSAGVDESRHDAVKASHDVMQAVPSAELQVKP